MTTQSFLSVEPKDLRFRVDSKKQPPTVLYLRNVSDERVAFKVKTTAPKRYVVKPSADVIEAKSAMEVKVFIQQSKDLTAAAVTDCRDKFLIQSTPVPSDWAMKTDAQAIKVEGESKTDVFNKKDNMRLVEEKLKVLLEAPPAPPSPVPEMSETAELTNASPTAVARSAGLPSSNAVGSHAGRATGSGSVSSMGQDLAAENRQLREKLAMMELKSSEMGAGKEGFRILHLIIVAIICFLLGWFL